MANMLLGAATNVLEWTGFVLQWTLSKLKYTVLKLSIISGILIFLLWLSVLLFASFYWIYMPSSSHINKVHFDFDVCEEGIGMCSFPKANLTFGKDGREEILRAGQVYRILIHLQVPESPINQELGMFMVRLKMYDRNGKITSHSSRSAVLHFQSFLLKIIKTLAFTPFLLSGFMEETQDLEIEMFPSYIDDYNSPSTGAIIELQSKKVQIYSATLNIYAYFTGLRYYLFYWPVTSGIIGTLCNFIFFCVVALLSYLKYFYEAEEEIIDPVILNRRYSLFDRRIRMQAQLDKERDEAEESDESAENKGESEGDRSSVMTTISPPVDIIVSDDSHHDIQEESIGALTPDDDGEVVIKSGDVTLLPTSNLSLRNRRPSLNVHFDLPDESFES